MPSTTSLVTFMVMVMALLCALCSAAPSQADNFTTTDIGVSRASDPNSLGSVPNLNRDIFKNKNRCYYTDHSETWGDMGGQHSSFINNAVFNMCNVIATFTSNTGFKKDDVMALCKEVPKNTQGKNYDRSIGVILTYRGPNDFVQIDAQRCYMLMQKAMGCGAGGEFVVSDGDNPRHWWEAKADPNRKDCKYNKIDNIV